MFRVELGNIEGFLLELDDLSQRKAIHLLRRLEAGTLPFLPHPHGEKVEDGIYALRITSASNARLYYSVKGHRIVLLAGHYKRTRKIPREVLEQCRRRVQELGERP